MGGGEKGARAGGREVRYSLPSSEPAGAYVKVALNVPQLQTLTYRAREPLASKIVPGLRVLVPLGRRRVTGYVVSQPERELPAGVDPASLRDVAGLLEEEPLLTDELMALTRWVAEYYCCGWGEALRAALPGVKERKSVERYRLSEAGRREAALAAGGWGLPGLEGEGSLRARLLAALRERPRRAAALAAAFGRGTGAELERLAGAGLVERVEEEEGGSPPARALYVRLGNLPTPEERAALKKRAPRQAAVVEALERAPGGGRLLLRELERLAPGARAACGPLAKKGWAVLEEDALPSGPPAPGEGEEARPAPPPDLTPAQREAFEASAADIREGRFSVTLLHGVTGSGKTEVYIRLAEEAVRMGRTGLVLVPEIGLTPQLLGRFRARFGERVACLHSAFPERQRASEWRRARRGEAQVVVGTRSAVFAPLPRLGFIAVDEEHDGSYKQEESPRYHARDTAIVRARRAGVPAVLGSATPSVESFSHARRGRYRLKELPERPGGRPLPRVRLVDLRREGGSDPKTPALLSADLARAIGERLERGEQTLLFLNRRGFSSVLLCRDCGEAVQCAHCSAPLTFHREGGGRMQCHLCDFASRPPHQCPACRSERVGYFGLGTERVEAAARARFPGARVQRLDRDAVRRAGAFDRILGAVRRGEVDILIGTQMVAKGHDFPRLTLVGWWWRTWGSTCPTSGPGNGRSSS